MKELMNLYTMTDKKVLKKIYIVFTIIGLVMGGIAVFLPYKTILILFVLGFLLFSASNLYPALSLALFIFPLSPLYFGLDLGKGLPIVNIQRVLLVILIMIWVFKNMLRKKAIPHTPLNNALLVVFSVQLFSTLFSSHIHISILRFLAIVFEQYLLFYLVFDIIRTPKQIKRIFIILLITGVIISAMGIIEFQTRTNLFGNLKPVRETMVSAREVQLRMGAHRIEVSFGHAIALGMFLVLLIPLAQTMFSLVKSTILKFFWGISVFFMVLALLFTLSRSPWLGAIGSQIILFLKQKQRRISILLLLIIFFSFFLSLSKGDSIFVNIIKQSNPFNADYGTLRRITQGRIDTWYMVVRGLEYRLILGYGLAAGGSVTRERPVDNYLFLLLLETGVLGISAFILLMIKVFSTLWRSYKKATSKEEEYLLLGIISSIGGFLIVLALGSSMMGASYYFWILLALGMRMVVNQKQAANIGRGMNHFHGE